MKRAQVSLFHVLLGFRQPSLHAAAACVAGGGPSLTPSALPCLGLSLLGPLASALVSIPESVLWKVVASFDPESVLQQGGNPRTEQVSGIPHAVWPSTTATLSEVPCPAA